MSKRVFTINGEHLLKTECRKFKEGWYKIGNINIENSGDCYIIGDVCYRFETGAIVYDHSVNCYIRNSKYLYEGIVSFNDNLEPVIGKFSSDYLSNFVILQTGESKIVIDESIIPTIYEQSVNDGKYYHKLIIPLISNFNTPRQITQEFKRTFPYNSVDYDGLFENTFDESLFKPNNVIENISKMLKDYTFGVEFETIAGIIPEKKCKKLGLMPLRDGSISGIEYATIPLKGAVGLQALKESCDALSKWTEFNDDCSVHLHIGGLERTPEFITAFFKLSMMIQDELFELFPVYKQLNKGVKRKNYTAPYPIYPLMSKFQNDLKNDFNVILNYLGRNRFSNESIFQQLYESDIKNINYHPNDPEGTSKWNIHNRYHFNNLIPLLYTNKQTIEFRLHSPTFSFDKILAFMLINISCIDFAKKYKLEILSNKFVKFSIVDILDELYNYDEKTLNNYIPKLKSYIYKRIDKLNDEFRHNNIFVQEHQVGYFLKSYESLSSFERTSIHITDDEINDLIRETSINFTNNTLTGVNNTVVEQNFTNTGTLTWHNTASGTSTIITAIDSIPIDPNF